MATQEKQAFIMSRRLHLPAPFPHLTRVSAWSAALTVVVTGVAAGGFAASASTASAPRAAATLGIVPKPVSVRAGTGRYTLPRNARIVAAPGARAAAGLAVARDLAAYLRPATGYRLPAITGMPRAGDIVLKIGRPAALPSRGTAEGYQLTTTAAGARIEAPSAHGLYNGIQTLRQLLPAWISSRSVRQGPWTAPAVSVTDYPRYSYRG